MKNRERIGWIIVSTSHPRNDNEVVDYSSFDSYKKGAIKKFIDGSGEDWNFWRKKYGFKAVKAKIKIEILEN